LQKRPDIASALQQNARADTETRLQRAIRSPNLTVGGGYKRNAIDNSFVVGVTLPLQIFNRNEGGILRADAEQKRSANVEAALQKQVQLDVQQAYNSVEINRQRVEYIRTQHLGKAEETSKVTLTSYNLGGATLIDYLDAQRTYRDALRIYMRSLQGSLSATGVVSEDPARVAHVRTLARGLIEKIFARLGDRLSAGDPLVEYDNIELGLGIGEYQGAQAELRRSLTDLEVKTKILERSREMLKVGAVAQTTHDLHEAEVKDAEAKVSGARAAESKIAEQIRRFGWTDQDLAKLPSEQAASGHTLSHSILKAPFSGVVTSLHAVPSEVVEQGSELLAITDMSSLWVLADVYERDLSEIRTGQAVRVRVPSYPRETFAGKITYVADVMDPKTRTTKVRCLVANGSGLLKLEMFATVEIPIGQTSPILAVPSSSIQQIDGRPVVFVRNSRAEFQKREVQTGIESQGYTEIRSGLKQGEPAVSRGSFILKTAFLRYLIGEGDE
jgi:cobalt-zinc-cadmium efflux system membrane fusion protein